MTHSPQTRSGPFQNQPILDTMLAYYGKRGIKEYLPTDAPSLTGKNPVGALMLICTVVRAPRAVAIFSITDATLWQVECAFLMHLTGYFIKDNCPFSEKVWGHRTAIYLKLANHLSNSKWDGFNGALAHAQGLQNKLKECSKPVERWTDDPEEYYIMASDPVEPAE